MSNKISTDILVLNKSIIRPWKAKDVDSLAENANNKEIWINLRDRFPHPYTKKDAREWIALAQTQQPAINLAIEVKGLAVGGIGLMLQEDISRRSAEIGYWLGQKYWGQGIVTEAVSAFTDHAFANHDLCRIYALVFAWNVASTKVLEKSGYAFEGRLQKAITKDGKTVDALMYAITR